MEVIQRIERETKSGGYKREMDVGVSCACGRRISMLLCVARFTETPQGLLMPLSAMKY